MTDTATTVPATTLNEWKRLLRTEAASLDLDSADDRALYRTRIARKGARVRVEHLRGIVRSLGYATPSASRDGVLRQLADMWMVLPEHARMPADEIATDEARAEQTNAVALLATALAEGTLVGPRHAAVARLSDMVAVLVAMTPDDRS